MSHLYEAKQLKEDYPEETKGFTVFEVERIWEERSSNLEAGWLYPESEDVESVFDSFRFKEE